MSEERIISVYICQKFVQYQLAKEIGGARAAKELGIPEGTIHTWLKAVRTGKLDISKVSHTPTSAMSLAEETTMLRKHMKAQDKEIHRLKEENEFLEEASAFSQLAVGSQQKPKNDISRSQDRRRQEQREISRQGFYKYLANKDRPWKPQNLADVMKEILQRRQIRWYLWTDPDVSGIAAEAAGRSTYSQRAYRVQNHEAGRFEPPSKPKTERDYKSQPGNDEIR